MSVAIQGSPDSSPGARQARIRARLAATTAHERRLRVLLVLAHEAVGRQARTEAPGAKAPSSEAKRGTVSVPGGRDGYDAMVARVGEIARSCLPARAAVAVISRGDDALLVPGLAAAHFPSGRDGGYAGFYPADGEAAVAALEQCRRTGTEFLLVPATSFWWLDYYGELARHLLLRARVVRHCDDCLIFDLMTHERQGAPAPS